MKYNISCIYKSYQDEGANLGRVAAFIFFSGCNLNCPWCEVNHSKSVPMDIETILRKIQNMGVDSVILTGGEPTIQYIKPLIDILKKKKYWVAIETNGTNPVGHLNLDYIAVSPKPDTLITTGRNLEANLLPEITVTKANEVRLIYDPEIKDFDSLVNMTEGFIKADEYFISPIHKEGGFALKGAIHALGRVNKWRTRKWKLSIKMHKLLNKES